MSSADSKVGRLKEDLDTIFKKRETVIIFTQYADTMDFLREQLRQAYGSQVACYSGRGGEYWNGIAWVQVSKEYVKNAFREGEVVAVTTLGEIAALEEQVDMHSAVIVGGAESRIWEVGENVKRIITPRGYHRKYVY